MSLASEYAAMAREEKQRAQVNTLADEYASMGVPTMRSADAPWQEQMGAKIEGYLKPISNWAKEYSKGNGLRGGVIGGLAGLVVDPLLEPAQRAAAGEPNVYFDTTSENPLLWQAKPAAAELGLSALDLADAGIGSAAAFGIRRIPKLYHGVMSTNAGTVSPKQAIVEGGEFTRGKLAELKEKGTSMSRDPLGSLVGFTERRTPYATEYGPDFGQQVAQVSNPNQIIMGRPRGVEAKDVYNVPPDIYMTRVKLGDPEGMASLANLPLQEAEIAAVRDIKTGRTAAAYPENPTPYELEHIEEAAKHYDEYRSKYLDVLGHLDYDPETRIESWRPYRLEYKDATSRMRDLVNSASNLQGYRTGFDKAVRDISQLIAREQQPARYTGNLRSPGIVDMIKEAAGGEEGAKPVLDAFAKYHQLHMERAATPYGEVERTGIKPRDTLKKLYDRTGGDIREVGDPWLRRLYREEVKARNEAFDELNNAVNRVKPTERPPTSESMTMPLAWRGSTLAAFDPALHKPAYRKNEQLGFGIHFAEDKSLAQQYAEGTITGRRGKGSYLEQATLNIKKPLYADNIVMEGTPEFELAKKLAGNRLFTQKNEEGVRMAHLQNAIDSTSPQRAEKIIREAGYDGVNYMANVIEPSLGGYVNKGKSPSWVVFSPDQVQVWPR